MGKRHPDARIPESEEEIALQVEIKALCKRFGRAGNDLGQLVLAARGGAAPDDFDARRDELLDDLADVYEERAALEAEQVALGAERVARMDAADAAIRGANRAEGERLRAEAEARRAEIEASASARRAERAARHAERDARTAARAAEMARMIEEAHRNDGPAPAVPAVTTEADRQLGSGWAARVVPTRAAVARPGAGSSSRPGGARGGA